MKKTSTRYFLRRFALTRGGKTYRLPHAVSGFSLLEMIIVVVIIALAAMVITPMMTSADGIQLRSAASMIAADIEYAKSMAIGTQRTHTIVFDTSADSYQIEDAGGIIDHPVRRGSQYIVNFGAGSRLDSVDITQASFGGSSQVSFDFFGSPDSAGTVTLQAGTDTSTVTVGAVTGVVSTTP